MTELQAILSYYNYIVMQVYILYCNAITLYNTIMQFVSQLAR